MHRKLQMAQREKNRYFANRIAQTELARAHQALVAAEFIADDTIDVLEVRINPKHPRVTNAGKDAAYRLARVGDGAALRHALGAENVVVSKQTPTSSEIASFAAEAAKIADRLVTLPLGPVTNAAAIKEATGFDLTGFERIRDNYGIRHTMKQHGTPAAEAARGQIAVSLDDFGMIPLITSAPDTVSHDGKNKIGRDVLVFTKLIDGIGYRHVEEIRGKKKLVATDSMRKKKGPWGP